jgi:hypothetical protein
VEAKAATLYAPNYWNDHADYDDELEYTSECFDDIYALFIQYGSNYDWVGNFQNFDDPSVYTSNIWYVEHNYDEITVFSKGHIAPQGGGSYSLVVNDTDPVWMGHVNDIDDICPNTEGNTKFAWIWHCATAMGYPPIKEEIWGPVLLSHSMPYAWTKNRGMIGTGPYEYWCSDPDQVYLGFIYYSPQFRALTGYDNHDYGEFVVSVFTHLLEDGDTVYVALNKASHEVFNVCYANSPLNQGQYMGTTTDPLMPIKWSYMQIYGDPFTAGVF